MRIAACCVALAVLALPTLAHADPCEGDLPARAGQSFSGAVRCVGDGDSLCIGPSSDPNTWIEVRLADFNAPELNSRGGQPEPHSRASPWAVRFGAQPAGDARGAS
ncbi:MAG TPA: hypothetical protein VJ748_06915 [Vitreimonas sp.]|nr:hypothetical protein [Vitreimonas sp.]